jgi:membrane-anchored glycerophosphoryl diester phosphodiesterase (GDPDase)
MGENLKVRLELNIATALLVLSGCGIATMTTYAQFEHITPDNVERIASMPAASLLALITILSLILTGYLIRLLFGKLLAALDNNTKTLAEMARLLAECPCIRDPRNN